LGVFLGCCGGTLALMADLEYWPEHFAALFALMRCVFSIFHLVAELEKHVLDVFEAIWGRLSVAGCAYGGHVCL
jgi:hypothetical protein